MLWIIQIRLLAFALFFRHECCPKPFKIRLLNVDGALNLAGGKYLPATQQYRR
jgi:hypothetical protein